MSKPRNLTMDPLVVGMEGAAFLLNTSEDKVRELLRAGFIREVPHLTSPARRAIAITELQRFVAVGGDRGPQGGCVVSAIETTGTELTPAMLDLFEHEKVIEQGLAGFVEVGLALLARSGTARSTGTPATPRLRTTASAAGRSAERTDTA